jgi:hypothetical protein
MKVIKHVRALYVDKKEAEDSETVVVWALNMQTFLSYKSSTFNVHLRSDAWMDR